MLSKQFGVFACQQCLDNGNIKDNCNQTGQPQLCSLSCLMSVFDNEASVKNRYKTRSKDLQQCVNRDTTVKLMTKTCLKSLHAQMLNVTMFHHLNTNRWDLHINQPWGGGVNPCIKHICCISPMNFYRSNFKHKIYGLYTVKYGNDILVRPYCDNTSAGSN